LGSAKMTVSQFLKLSRGAVVELDKLKTDTLDIEVNGYPVAKGEVTIVEDRIGITIKELSS
jgi:flagellar motor switch protein FliN